MGAMSELSTLQCRCCQLETMNRQVVQSRENSMKKLKASNGSPKWKLLEWKFNWNFNGKS